MQNSENNTNQEKSPKDQPIIVKTTWAKAISRIGVTAIVVLGLIFVFVYFLKFTGKAFKATDKAISNRMNELTNIASAFKTGSVVTEFTSYATKIRASNNLQVAQLETVESFSKSETTKHAWDLIEFSAEVEIRAPVEYTFYLDLLEQKSWIFELQNEQAILNQKEETIFETPEIVVRTPKIQWNTPAINVSEMKYWENKSIGIDEDKMRLELQKEITAICNERAKEKIPLVREIARAETKKFLENWIVNVMFKDYLVKPRIESLYFADEWEVMNQDSSSNAEKEKPI